MKDRRVPVEQKQGVELNAVPFLCKGHASKGFSYDILVYPSEKCNSVTEIRQVSFFLHLEKNQPTFLIITQVTPWLWQETCRLKKSPFFVLT
jgi:hypothetical protein